MVGTKREAVRHLKNNKAPGDDGISNEIWKRSDTLVDHLVCMCNYALEGDVLKEWVDYPIVPIHKKGSVTDPNDYRGIALLATGGKIFARILTKHLMQWLVLTVIPESQCGYWPGWSTEDVIYLCMLYLWTSVRPLTKVYFGGSSSVLESHLS